VIWRLLCALVLITLCACTGKPSEQALRAQIDALQAAGTKRDVSAMMDIIADDFRGQFSSMDKTALQAYLMAIRLRARNVGVTRTNTDITLSGDVAQVQLSLLVTDGGNVLPSSGEYLRAKTTWRFVGGAWRLTEANWQEGVSLIK
jgi:Domain of unknown function (DUF4440)